MPQKRVVGFWGNKITYVFLRIFGLAEQKLFYFSVDIHVLKAGVKLFYIFELDFVKMIVEIESCKLNPYRWDQRWTPIQTRDHQMKIQTWV